MCSVTDLVEAIQADIGGCIIKRTGTLADARYVCEDSSRPDGFQGPNALFFRAPVADVCGNWEIVRKSIDSDPVKRVYWTVPRSHFKVLPPRNGWVESALPPSIWPTGKVRIQTYIYKQPSDDDRS